MALTTRVAPTPQMNRAPKPEDRFVYDHGVDRKEYSSSLLGPKDSKSTDDFIKNHGFMSLENVRNFAASNVLKGNRDTKGDLTMIDPEIMMYIDSRINYKIFISEDNIYTRDELYDCFPFAELKVEPEKIFVQQEIGVFPAKKYAIESDLEYLARDVGDDSVDFIMLEDLVGRASRKSYKDKRSPLKIAKTKIFIGKEDWDDFKQLQKLARGVNRLARHQLTDGHSFQNPLLLLVGATNDNRLLTDGLENERLQKRREEDDKRREEEDRRREVELKRREEENKIREEKVAKDLERIEKMFVSLGQPSRSSSDAPKNSAPKSAEKNPDSAVRPPDIKTAEIAPKFAEKNPDSAVRPPDIKTAEIAPGTLRTNVLEPASTKEKPTPPPVPQILVAVKSNRMADEAFDLSEFAISCSEKEQPDDGFCYDVSEFVIPDSSVTNELSCAEDLGRDFPDSCIDASRYDFSEFV